MSGMSGGAAGGMSGDVAAAIAAAQAAAIAAGWNQLSALIATITNNSYLYASSTGVYGFDTGVTFPVGSRLTLINNGTICGAGGAGCGGVGLLVGLDLAGAVDDESDDREERDGHDDEVDRRDALVVAELGSEPLDHGVHRRSL